MKPLLTKFSSRHAVLFCALVFLYACQKDSEFGPKGPSTEEITAFNNEVDGMTQFEQPQELSEPQKLSEEPPAQDQNNTTLECYTANYKAAPGFDEMLALDPTSDVIYPGALVIGESIPTGEYLPLVAERDSITLSISLENLSGSPVVKIGDPKLSTVREGVKKILDQEVTGGTPAKINYSISQVHTKEQLNLALGANYRSAATKVSASFDFESTSYTNKFVMKFLQVYYTIDMDLPRNPSDLFTKLPDPALLGATSPVYVSTVTYGRMILYTMETNYTKTEVDAAFSASFGSSDGSINAEYEKVFRESSIKALVIGGSGAEAAKTIKGPEEVFSYIATGGNYSKDSPGAPLSYKLRYVKDNAVARVVLGSEYTVRTCDLAYPEFSIEMVSIRCTGCEDGNGSAAELYGNVDGYFVVKDKLFGNKVTWRYSRDNVFSLGKGDTKPSADALSPPYTAPTIPKTWCIWVAVCRNAMPADLPILTMILVPLPRVLPFSKYQRPRQAASCTTLISNTSRSGFC
ncbi:MAG: hypothetical protein HC819_11005 [Cyclobacteriaceae bacterium]|nr:hypothetical protein [Cyclobacteriaceae bacterium]